MKRRPLIITIILTIVVVALIIWSAVAGKDKTVVLESEVIKGPFEIAVMVTGELEAENVTNIEGPSALRSRNLRIREVKIQDMVMEGTVVDSGDWVATLDRSEADNMLKDMMDELEQEESVYTRAKLDTTIELRNLRDNLVNLKFAMEEAEITLEQSKFEPPATIRQAEISLQRAKREYEQAQKNYKLRVQEARANVREAEISLQRDRRRREDMIRALEEFDIRAPASGMVIYKRDWDGSKRAAGSEISSWDLTVATLPDLSTMISKTYVNEIDISKIKEGQFVNIGVDAFPEREYTGMVIEVANIGEQLPNTDAKVFEVRIEINESDTILRPSMTTSNSIITQIFEDVLYLPLEAVHANDSITYVYAKPNEKKIVVLGESNENFIIIEKGLKKGEKVYLSTPEDTENFKFTGLDLIEVIKEREAEKEKENSMQQKAPNRSRMGRPASGNFKRVQQSGS